MNFEFMIPEHVLKSKVSSDAIAIFCAQKKLQVNTLTVIKYNDGIKSYRTSTHFIPFFDIS